MFHFRLEGKETSVEQLRQLFTAHPASVGETYGHHLRRASFFGAQCILIGLVSLVHAFLPFVFQKTASAKFMRLSAWLLNR